MMSFNPFEMLDEASLEEKRQRELRAAKCFEDDFKVQLSTKQGRRFVWYLLSQSGVFWTTYNPKAANIPIDMAFSEGRKQTGYELMAQALRLCPALYSKMIEESKDYERD